MRLACLCLLAALYGLALSPSRLYAQSYPISFQHLTLEDGLSSNSVRSIAQDRQGFLWFGSIDGLNRYDGHTFLTFRHDPARPTSIADNFLFALQPDAEGNLWVGTDRGGLNKYDPTSHTFTRYLHDPTNPNSLANNKVAALLLDHEQTLWIGTEQGLSRMNLATEGITNYHHDPDDATSLSHNYVIAFHEDRAQNLWIGTFGGGASRFDRKTNTFQHFRHEPGNDQSLSDDRVLTVYEDVHGMIWFGSWSGLTAYDPRTQRFRHYQHNPDDPSSLSDNLVTRIYEDHAHRLWIATRHGLNQWDRERGRFISYTHAPNNPTSLSYNHVAALYQDHTGVFWVGTAGGGINKFTPLPPHQHYQHDPDDATSLNDNHIRALYEDANGYVWIGSDGGRDRLDLSSHTFVSFPVLPANKPAVLGREWVSAISTDHQGAQWLGTYKGLIRVDQANTPITLYTHDHRPTSLSNDEVMDIFETSDLTLWISTRNGLNRYNRLNDTFTRYTDTTSVRLIDNYITSLNEDHKGRLLVTTRQGLAAYVAGQDHFDEVFTAATPGAPKSGLYLNAVYEDPRHRLWMASSDAGVFIYHPTTGTTDHLDTNNGLPSNSVLDFIITDAGVLWALTTRGLAQYDAASHHFLHHPLNPILHGTDPKALLHSSGKFIYGNEEGMFVFDLALPEASGYTPPIVFTDVKIMNTSIRDEIALSTLKDITLPYNENFVSLDFAVLDYRAPTKNRYRYKLDGHQFEWLDAGNVRTANYFDLDPGDYVFAVQGTNQEGRWPEDSLRLPITVLPPWWATYWFRTLATLTVIGLLTAAYQYRIQQLLRLERTRQRIADDLHDEIGSKISNVALRLGLAGRNPDLPETEKQHLQDLSAATRTVVDDLRDVVWIVDAGHDDLASLGVRIEQIAGQLLTGIRYSFETTPAALPSLPLGMEQRRHLYLWFREALNNAIRHGQPQHVTIRMAYAPDQLTLQVEDDGQGFAVDTVTPGRGLSTLQRRAEQLGGAMQLHSTPGRGTTLTLTAPVA